MIFPYNDSTYVFEGSWDSGSEIARFNFPYLEAEPERETHIAPRREAILKQNLREARVNFVDLEEEFEEVKDTDAPPAVANRKLCMVESPLVVLYDPKQYENSLMATVVFRSPPQTEQEYYRTIVDYKVQYVASKILNIYMSAMERIVPLPDQSAKP